MAVPFALWFFPNIKLRRLNQKYKEFSKAAGLPEQRDRMKVLYADQEREKYIQKAISISNLKTQLSKNPSTVLQTTIEVDVAGKHILSEKESRMVERVLKIWYNRHSK